MPARQHQYQYFRRRPRPIDEMFPNYQRKAGKSGETTSEELSATNILMANKYCPAFISLLPALSAEDKEQKLDRVNLFVYEFVMLFFNQLLSLTENQQLGAVGRKPFVLRPAQRSPRIVPYSTRSSREIRLVLRNRWSESDPLLFRAVVDPYVTDK